MSKCGIETSELIKDSYVLKWNVYSVKTSSERVSIACSKDFLHRIIIVFEQDDMLCTGLPYDTMRISSVDGPDVVSILIKYSVTWI